MKVEELRIGNYVAFEGRVFTIKSLSDKGIESLERKHLGNEIMGGRVKKDSAPIQLTNEWLVKLGFVENKVESKLYHFYDMDIQLPQFFYWKDSLMRKIKYVHQLQNLYFALTERELFL